MKIEFILLLLKKLEILNLFKLVKLSLVINLSLLHINSIYPAVHPQCNHVHAGSILTITGSSVIIKFFPTELGAVSVSDTKIKRVSPEEATQIMDYFSGSNLKLTGIPMNRLGDHDGDKSANQSRLIQDLDFNALALFIKILERFCLYVEKLILTLFKKKDSISCRIKKL